MGSLLDNIDTNEVMYVRSDLFVQKEVNFWIENGNFFNFLNITLASIKLKVDLESYQSYFKTKVKNSRL